jgi:hypothetical protein
MTSPSFILGFLACAALVLTPAATAKNLTGCGIAFASDPIAAQLDRSQSAAAAKICGLYLNSRDLR